MNGPPAVFHFQFEEEAPRQRRGRSGIHTLLKNVSVDFHNLSFANDELTSEDWSYWADFMGCYSA